MAIKKDLGPRHKPYIKRTADMKPELRPLELPSSVSDGLLVIYFLGSQDEQEIKIGKTKNNDKDLKRIMSHGAYGYRHLLALVRGTGSDEIQIHKYFRERGSSVPGKSDEVHRTDVVLPYLVWLRNQYYVATTLQEFEQVRYGPAIQSTVWMPHNEGARVSILREPDLFTSTVPWSKLPERVITGDDYYTPQHIIDPIREFFGEIDLDPASHVWANKIIRASKFYTLEQNGLAQTWHGRVWLNPPFSAWSDWVAKTLEEVRCGRVTEIVLLAATRTMTAKYFVPLLRTTSCLCVISGRFPFWGVNSAATPPDGHFLMYIGDRPKEFEERVGSQLGPCFLTSAYVQAQQDELQNESLTA